jgi:hypothetical protein
VSIRIQSVPVPRRKDWMTTVTKRSINNNNNNNTVGKKMNRGRWEDSVSSVQQQTE